MTVTEQIKIEFPNFETETSAECTNFDASTIQGRAELIKQAVTNGSDLGNLSKLLIGGIMEEELITPRSAYITVHTVTQVGERALTEVLDVIKNNGLKHD